MEANEQQSLRMKGDRPYHTHICRICHDEIGHYGKRSPDGLCKDPDRSLCYKCLAKSFRVTL